MTVNPLRSDRVANASFFVPAGSVTIGIDTYSEEEVKGEGGSVTEVLISETGVGEWRISMSMMEGKKWMEERRQQLNDV